MVEVYVVQKEGPEFWEDKYSGTLVDCMNKVALARHNCVDEYAWRIVKRTEVVMAEG